MILRIICPKCNKDSYSSSVENFKPCPYCGIIFSGKYGTDKRREYRKNKEIPCICMHKENQMEATTINFSNEGIGIKIFGKKSLPLGDIIELKLGDSPIKGEVKWTVNLPNEDAMIAGLKILNGSFNSFKL